MTLKKLQERNIANKHNRLKNPNWREAEQMASIEVYFRTCFTIRSFVFFFSDVSCPSKVKLLTVCLRVVSVNQARYIFYEKLGKSFYLCQIFWTW